MSVFVQHPCPGCAGGNLASSMLCGGLGYLAETGRLNLHVNHKATNICFNNVLNVSHAQKIQTRGSQKICFAIWNSPYTYGGSPIAIRMGGRCDHALPDICLTHSPNGSAVWQKQRLISHMDVGKRRRVRWIGNPHHPITASSELTKQPLMRPLSFFLELL